MRQALHLRTKGSRNIMAKIITMPKLGLTMTEGTITKWLKQIGEPVKKGDLIFEVATDKITNQVEALEEGLLRRILVTEGKTVPVGTPVAILAAADERGEPSPLTTLGTDVKASPAARKLAREHGVDLIQITPTRPDGRIVEKDVFAYLEQQKKAAVSTTITKAETVRTTPVAERLAQELGIDLASITAPGRIGKEDVFRAWATAQEQQGETPERREPLAGMRRIIAQRMSESKRIAPTSP
jgi:pyruvate dehydrogenase E2 component (dihydrolipoamide acetyltransferase)